MRSMRMIGWGLMIGSLVMGCAAGGPPVGELTEADGLKVDESRLTARAIGDRLELDLTIERTRKQHFEGTVRVELADLEKNSLDQIAVPFSLDQPEKTLHLALTGLPADATLEQLGQYLLRYRIEFGGHTLFGSRSVFASVAKLETQVLAPDRLYAGEPTWLRVLARDPDSGQAMADLPVRVELQLGEHTLELGQGTTDPNGTAEIRIQAPADELGQGELRIFVDRDQDNPERVAGQIEVLREEKILLTTDKPLYQPGQTMHLRLLALRRPELHAVDGEPVLFEVRDGKGNKVFKQRGQTNAFGIAAADFRLAGEVNLGPFEITAQVGQSQAKKTVEVKRYALPKFGVNLQLDRAYYLPGEHVTGQLEARYFFGQPVAGGQARVRVLTFDVGLVQIGEVTATLNDDGLAGFAFDLPTVFAGVNLLQGDAYLQFDTEVTDLAEHTESATQVSSVSAAPLKISLVPESGELAPGVANRIHVVTADPTGTPVSAQVRVWQADQPVADLQTDARGLGELSVLPGDAALVLRASAQDDLGNQVEREFAFQAGQSGQTVLLRVDRRLFQVGETAQLSIWAADARDRIYLDVIKGNQTLLTHSLDLVDGRASYELDLTPEMEGNLQFDAYYLTRQSQIVRDTQLVLVEGARDLNVSVSLDKQTYLPAESAQVSFQVSDPTGAGVPAAIGLSIVDEAVFALTDSRPGLAKVFFEIEQDLLAPRYQIIASSALGDYLDDDLPAEQREAAAEVVFAAARGLTGHGIEKNTYVDASARVGQQVRARVNADAEAILTVLQGYAEYGLISQENFPAWLDHHKSDWFDPFGQAYRVELLGEQDWDYRLVFHSAGPDERVGTPDDVSSDGYYLYWISGAATATIGTWPTARCPEESIRVPDRPTTRAGSAPMGSAARPTTAAGTRARARHGCAPISPRRSTSTRP